MYKALADAIRDAESEGKSLAEVALTMQGTLGLVCDPLGGLVELPCVFRNATGSAIALAGIEMALAGITFAIPVDEVIDVMGGRDRKGDGCPLS